jgi:hypothetical protein
MEVVISHNSSLNLSHRWEYKVIGEQMFLKSISETLRIYSAQLEDLHRGPN